MFHDFELGQPIYWLNKFGDRIEGTVLETRRNSVKVEVVEDGKRKVFQTPPSRLEHREG